MKSRIILSRSLQRQSHESLLAATRFSRCMPHAFTSAQRPQQPRNYGRSSASSGAAAYAMEEDPISKHCNTCTCESPQHHHAVLDDHHLSFACGTKEHENEKAELPPPLPEPQYSVHKRILPSSLTALSSPKGRRMIMDCFQQETAESYWALTEQFVNQSDPAFCGITTLVMVLNAMSVDPNVRWRGGWRFYGSEEVLLDRCCLSAERIRRVGVTLDEFAMLGRCNGLTVDMKRPDDQYTVDDFRQDINKILTDNEKESILVSSFSRQHLDQTGDGHFSPIAAYHEETDQVLVLDVARFKYQPYFCSVSDLYNAMIPKDATTNQSRGWFLLVPPESKSFVKQKQSRTESRRPAELVPKVGEEEVCPVGKVKVDFCKANPERDS